MGNMGTPHHTPAKKLLKLVIYQAAVKYNAEGFLLYLYQVFVQLLFPSNVLS